VLKFFAVEKNAALLLLLFALTGLTLANSPLASGFNQFADTPMRWFDSFSLSPSEVSGEFLMTGFFLLVGLELNRELTSGVFRDKRALLIPTLAAFFGAVAPALAYLALNANDPETSRGWGIPMATDLTFALAVFSIFGKKIPTQGRIFVLAFAVIDDLIAIAVIAIFVSEAINFDWVLATAAMLTIFWLAGKVGFYWLMPLTAIISWCLLFQSGVQPAVVGVLLGLLVPAKKVSKLEKAVHPWVSLLILPIFALFATAVNLAGGFSLLAPVALAVLLRPVGKIVGINFGVWLGGRLTKVKTFDELTRGDYLALSTLGGIGFSVALLISNQTFGSGSELATQAIVATLLAMLISVVLAAFALTRKRA
jgi:NhaA family Na+:H+ antiporter